MRDNLRNYLEGAVVPFASPGEYIIWAVVSLGIIIIGLVIFFKGHDRATMPSILATIVSTSSLILCGIFWAVGIQATSYSDATDLTSSIENGLTDEYKISEVKFMAKVNGERLERPEKHVFSDRAPEDPKGSEATVGHFEHESLASWLTDLDRNDWTDRPLVYVLTEDKQKVVYEIGFDEDDELTLYSTDGAEQVDPEALRR